MDAEGGRSPGKAELWARALFFFVAVCFFLYLLRYYLTGAGGPTLLAVTLVPVTFMLFTLDALRTDLLYPKLGLVANWVIGALYLALSLLVLVYMNVEFVEIRTVRLGIWTPTDLLIGAIMFALVMEYSRKRYFPLFIINLALIVYTVYGWVVPGMFGHPGLSWTRVISAMSVEITTGVFSRLPQIALTLIGSFMLVLSVLRAFGCVESLLKAASRIAGMSPQALPQAAVLGSFGVAAISGSGAANAITTGSATIPAMIASGMPRVTAAAIETSSSLGGQLMPPIMGISAFLMAEFLGESYFEVVARGYAPALIYYAGVAAAVYLIAARHRIAAAASPPRIELFDRINILAYGAVVLGLVYLMGVVRLAPMLAALRIFAFVFIALGVLFVALSYWAFRSARLPELWKSLRQLVEGFAEMTTDITLLLAVLSIMTGAFVITGIPTKVGFVLMEAASIHLIVMVVVAFSFGTLLGTGLPPAPTYIITALVIAPFMVKAGINPWVVHFFAFFIAVWGELTPPTSVVAAVTSRIAEASFMWTMMKAIQICIPLFLLMGGIFTRPELVIEPGAAQLLASGLVLAGTLGVTFSVHGKYSEARGVDRSLRAVLAVCSFAAIFHPNTQFAALAVVPAAALIVYGFLRSKRIAPVYGAEEA